MKSYQAFQDAPGAPQNVSETAKSNLNSCGYRVFGELGSPWEAFWTPLGPLGAFWTPPTLLQGVPGIRMRSKSTSDSVLDVRRRSVGFLKLGARNASCDHLAQQDSWPLTKIAGPLLT